MKISHSLVTSYASQIPQCSVHDITVNVQTVDHYALCIFR